MSRRHVHASIDRAGTLGGNELDLYFCHREDPGVLLAEMVLSMGDLVQLGKVRAWGTCCWRPANLRWAHRLAAELGGDPPGVEQPRNSLLERSIESDLVPCCRQLVSLVVLSPLAGGGFDGKYFDGVPPNSRQGGRHTVGRPLFGGRCDGIRPRLLRWGPFARAWIRTSSLSPGACTK